jgi:hypothetical protein
MLNEQTCEGCKTSWYSRYNDVHPLETCEVNHQCSYLYKELVNKHNPELQCPCEECVVKAMCDWMSKQCCSLFLDEFYNKIEPKDLKYTGSSSSSISSNSMSSSCCQKDDKIKTTKFDRFYDKRKKDGLYKHSKTKTKYR